MIHVSVSGYCQGYEKQNDTCKVDNHVTNINYYVLII